MAQIVDSYSETNGNNGIFVNSSLPGIGQSFTGNGGILNSVKWHLAKVGSPTGNANAKIYAHSGTFGTSSIPSGIALATSDNFDVSILTADFELITFTFSGAEKIAIADATKYVVTFEYGGGNSSNKVELNSDSSSPAHSGNLSYNFSPWSADNTLDTCFYVYKDDLNPAEPIRLMRGKIYNKT